MQAQIGCVSAAHITGEDAHCPNQDLCNKLAVAHFLGFRELRNRIALEIRLAIRLCNADRLARVSSDEQDTAVWMSFAMGMCVRRCEGVIAQKIREPQAEKAGQMIGVTVSELSGCDAAAVGALGAIDRLLDILSN